MPRISIEYREDKTNRVLLIDDDTEFVPPIKATVEIDVNKFYTVVHIGVGHKRIVHRKEVRIPPLNLRERHDVTEYSYHEELEETLQAEVLVIVERQ